MAYISQNKLYTIYDRMLETKGVEGMLESLVQAMGTDELEQNLRFIDRMEFANEFFSDEEDDEDED